MNSFLVNNLEACAHQKDFYLLEINIFAVFRSGDRVPPSVVRRLRSAGRYDDEHNICGLESVVIVELKRGGFELTVNEKDQAQRYCRAIRDSGRVDDSTKIICYVLGSTISNKSSAGVQFTEGNTTVILRRFSTIIAQAKARTFNLIKNLERYENIDEVVKDENVLF